jgi:hypothetical protein
MAVAGRSVSDPFLFLLSYRRVSRRLHRVTRKTILDLFQEIYADAVAPGSRCEDDEAWKDALLAEIKSWPGSASVSAFATAGATSNVADATWPAWRLPRKASA